MHHGTRTGTGRRSGPEYSALKRAGLDGSALLDAHRTWGSYIIGYLVVEQQGRAASSEWRPVVGPATPVTASLDAFQAARDMDEQFDIGLHMQFDAIESLARASR